MMKAPCLDASSCLVLDPDAPYGVYYAVRAVASDFKDVFGVRPKIVAASAADAGLAVMVEHDGKLAQQHGFETDIGEPETFCFRLIQHDGRPTVLISANDERGAIFGLYHFSHTHLGAEPFKHITGFRPQRRERAELHDLSYTRLPHAFRFRGWHTECNVSRWPYDLGLERAYWQRLIETLMRCQGNMIKPETNKPESMQVSLSQKMGLMITQEHCEPFGTGTWDMESDEPGFNFIFDDYPQIFLDAWEDSMQRYPDPARVIWTLGIRGRADRPFWEVDPARFDTDAKRGAYISRVLAAQKDLILRRYGQHKPAFIHNTWMEGNRLMQEGHTHLPEDVHTVWSNNGYGSFRSMVAEGCRADQIRENLPDAPPAGEHGVYYHVMVGDGCAPSLMQYVPPDRIEKELGKVYQRKMTAYLLLNVGQIATTVMPTAAVADFWNNPQGWTGEAFLHRWCEKHFTAKASEAHTCYRDYFDALVRYGEWGGWDDYVFGDMGYARMARLFVNAALSHASRTALENMPAEAMTRRFFANRRMTFEESLGHIEGKMADALPRWQHLHEKAAGVCDQLDGRSKRFFDTDVCVQTEMHLYWVKYVLHMLAAVRAYERGSSGRPAARDEAKAGQQCIRKVYEAGKRRDFSRWYEACDWPMHWRYANLPEAWAVADLLIGVVTESLEARAKGYLNTHDIAHAPWADSWGGPAHTHPFEDACVEKALPPGTHFQVFGRYKGDREFR